MSSNDNNPTRAIIDRFVSHGFLIDTEAMDRGEDPTIMCMNNPCRWSSPTWSNLSRIVRLYQICDRCPEAHHAPH